MLAASLVVVLGGACNSARQSLPTNPDGGDWGEDAPTVFLDASGADLGPDGSDARRDAAAEVAAPECPTGKHTCPGGCVSDMDPQTCGASCTPCEAPTDGTATCDGKSCGGSCLPGKQLCHGACIDATAPCAGGCPTGQHVCGNLCPSVMDVKACGTSCVACPVPTGATQASCDGTKCDFACTTGYHKCGTACALDNDATACGMACISCATDPNGTAQCVGGNCGLACKTGYHICGGKCVSNERRGQLRHHVVHRLSEADGRLGELRRDRVRSDLPVGNEAVRGDLHRRCGVVLRRVFRRHP